VTTNDALAEPPLGPNGAEGGTLGWARAPLRAFRLGLIGLNVLAVVVCAAMLHNQLQAETALSRLHAANTAALLARGVAATLDNARLAVDGVADRLEADLSGPGIQRAGLRPMVDRAVERVPDLQTIGLFDQTGAQICGEQDDLCRGLNVADRDYFLAYRGNAAAKPGIFGPFDSRLDSRRVMILARALRHRDGRFAGLAIGLLPLQNLETIVATASLGPGGVASLRTADALTLLARAPALPTEQQAAQLASLYAALGEQMRRAPEAGVFSVALPVDGVSRINAYQRLPGYPIYALVGDAVADSQAAWRSLLVWTTGFLLVFAASSLAIERAVTRSRRNELRAQALFDEAPCGYHTLDAEGRFLTINATELAWLGRQRDQIIGQARAGDFLTEKGRAMFAREFPRLLAGETVRGLEYDLVTNDMRPRRVSVDAAPVFDENGRFVSTNTVMHDISALHESRQALQQQNARQQLLLDNKLVGIARVADRRFVWVNAAFERLFGYEVAELVGQETSILYPEPAAFTAMGEAATAAMAQDGTYRATVELRRKDGSPMWADCSGAVLDGTGGEVIWFSTDVTELRRAESLRIEAAGLAAENRQLRETARLHSMFLSNMSHELRTPLNAVIGFVQLLQMPTMAADAEKRARYLGQIGASGKHLLDMIDSLLDLAKVEAGRVPLQPVPLEPGAVVQDVVDMLEGKARLKGVTVGLESSVLPMVRLDPLRLKQVLLNYLSNAIKFSHPNGQVVVSAFMSEQGRMRIEVRDHGIGISEVDQAQLFQRFRQLSAGATKAYEGTGIGLALVKQIVEAQGGRVGVRSELGKGSTFWAEWPVAL
jgi:PAS domain S-box-containing protein